MGEASGIEEEGGLRPAGFTEKQRERTDPCGSLPPRPFYRGVLFIHAVPFLYEGSDLAYRSRHRVLVLLAAGPDTSECGVDQIAVDRVKLRLGALF